MPWILYVAVTVCDCEANYLVVLAYKYTTLPVIQLLLCCILPFVLILSCIFLRARYSWKHISACFVCLLGVVLCILADAHYNHTADADSTTGNALLGDLLVLASAMCYAFSNVGQEYVISKGAASHIAERKAQQQRQEGGPDSADDWQSQRGDGAATDAGAGAGTHLNSATDTTVSSLDGSDDTHHAILLPIDNPINDKSDADLPAASAAPASAASLDLLSSRWEFLAYTGAAGVCICLLQGLLLERHALAAIDWADPAIPLCFLGYAGCVFGIYSIIPVALAHVSVASLNLAILSANFYGVIAGRFLFHTNLHWTFFCAFLLIMGGVIGFNLAEHSRTGSGGILGVSEVGSGASTAGGSSSEGSTAGGVDDEEMTSDMSSGAPSYVSPRCADIGVDVDVG
jgi:drug/metabolite transporter (DMT)-like permease